MSNTFNAYEYHATVRNCYDDINEERAGVVGSATIDISDVIALVKDSFSEPRYQLLTLVIKKLD